MLAEIRKLIEEKCGQKDWDFHIGLVVKYAMILAEKLGADAEITELGALLHDIGWIMGMKNDHNHEISGQPIAEKLLKDYGYPQDKIDQVKHIIAAHRGNSAVLPGTPEAKIVSNADAMSHFDAIPWLFKIALGKHENDVQKSTRWLYDKIERDWNKKITIPEAKDLVREKYEALRVVLEATLNLE